jgi:hypothetical protein
MKENKVQYKDCSIGLFNNEKKKQMMRIIGKRFILFGAKGEIKTDYLHIDKLILINNTINFC